MPGDIAGKRMGRPKVRNYKKVCLGLDKELISKVEKVADRYGWTQTFAYEYLLRQGLGAEAPDVDP